MAEYKELFYQSGIAKRLIVSFPNLSVTLGNEDIVSESMEISESLCSGTELRFGSCEASVFKLRIIGNAIPLIGEIFTVSMYVGDIPEPLVLGTYKVASDKPTADRRFRDIVAYDVMHDIINADVAAWYNGILPNKNSTTTLRAFRDSFAAHFGIEQEEITLPNDEMVVERTIEPESISGKDVLSAICEINGCFGHIGRNGKMQYIYISEFVDGLYPMDELYPAEDLFPLDDSAERLSQQKYISCKYEDFTTKTIGKLQIRQEENDIGCIVGNGENCYIIEGNFLVYGKDSAGLQAIGQKLFDIISFFWYRPASVKATGNPCLEVGSGIRVISQYGIVETYILERTLKGIHSLSDSYEAKGNEKYSEDVNSVQKSIVQIKGKLNVLTRTAEETRSQLIDVENELSSQILQTAEAISLEVKRAQSAESSLSVRANQIASSVSNLDSNLSSRITQNADSITAEVSRAQAAEAELRVSANEIALSVTNLEESVQSDIEVLSGQINLRTTQGQVSSMISVALDGITLSAEQITLSGNTTINDVLTIETNGDIKFSKPNSASWMNVSDNGISIWNGAQNTTIKGGTISMYTPILSSYVTVASIGAAGNLTLGGGKATFDGLYVNCYEVTCTKINGEAPITRAEYQSLVNRILALEGFI